MVSEIKTPALETFPAQFYRTADWAAGSFVVVIFVDYDHVQYTHLQVEKASFFFGLTVKQFLFFIQFAL